MDTDYLLEGGGGCKKEKNELFFVSGFFKNENDVLGLEYEDDRNGKVYLRRLSG